MSFINYPEETVTITRSEYDSLRDDARWWAGVDNWYDFDWAMKEYYGDDDE